MLGWVDFLLATHGCCDGNVGFSVNQIGWIRDIHDPQTMTATDHSFSSNATMRLLFEVVSGMSLQ